MNPHVTSELARFIAGLRFERISPGAVAHGKSLLLDALACALAGHHGEETPQIAAFASALAPAGDSTVIGAGRSSLAGATVLNGYLVTAVTLCDVYRPTVTHVTPVVVPPALAIAERDDRDGRSLLTALAAGLETTCRIGSALDFAAFRRRGWHGPGVIGPFGGAAAVGQLLGFDADTMTRAFGLAGSQAAGTFACWGTPTIKFHQCRGALSGLMAGLLAAQGFDSAREFLTAEHGGLYRAYDDGGGRPDKVVEDLGRRWEFEQVALRPWPAGSTIQGILTGVFDLVENHGLRPDQVKKLRVTASPRVAATNGGLAQYKNKFEALLSIHYVASVIFHDRALTLAQFEPARYNDPVLRRFSERIEVKAEPAFDGITAVVEAQTTDGRTLSVHVEHPRGAPENPMSWDQIADKFRGCARGRIPADRAEAVVSAVAGLETLGSVRGLMDLVRAPA